MKIEINESRIQGDFFIQGYLYNNPVFLLKSSAFWPTLWLNIIFFIAQNPVLTSETVNQNWAVSVTLWEIKFLILL
jgi:hypothetical protein